MLAAIPKTALSNARKHRSDGGQGQQPVGQMNSTDVDDGCPLGVRVLRVGGDDCLVRAESCEPTVLSPEPLDAAGARRGGGGGEECIE